MDQYSQHGASLFDNDSIIFPTSPISKKDQLIYENILSSIKIIS